jgi:hypothetical protein
VGRRVGGETLEPLELYAFEPPFDIYKLADLIEYAITKKKKKIIVVDSYTAFWSGYQGILESVAELDVKLGEAKKMYGAWSEKEIIHKKNLLKNLMNNSNTISIEWNLDEHGCLTVKGIISDFGGALMDEVPWKDEKDNITSIIVDRGIEEIGRNAFRDCINLEKVFLPSTLQRIHSYAFRNCLKLESIVTDKSFQYVHVNIATNSHCEFNSF